MAKKLEIKQIAEALSISTTTVSRALSGKGRVSKNTKARVQAYLKEQEALPAIHQRPRFRVCIHRRYMPVKRERYKMEV